MNVLAGPSGRQYRDWRGTFYPPGIARRRWLEHYARQFTTAGRARSAGPGVTPGPGRDTRAGA